MNHITILIIICGIGTFLTRWLPIKYSIKGRSPFLDSLSEFIAPSAIASLFIAMAWPWVNVSGEYLLLIAPIGGLLVTFVAYKLIGGLATPAIIGSISFALLKYHLLTF